MKGCVAGETGKDVEHFMSTRVSVVFVLVGEFKFARFDKVPDGEAARGDCRVPLSRAGRIFVSVLVAVRWDGDGEKLPLRKSEDILNDDESEEDIIDGEEDDCSICVRKAFSVAELISSFSRINKEEKTRIIFIDEERSIDSPSVR